MKTSLLLGVHARAVLCVEGVLPVYDKEAMRKAVQAELERQFCMAFYRVESVWSDDAYSILHREAT